tara:strand:- start:463 stop:726 length:264 start_codon:yes stop_codon:yes gene_type:complete
MRRQIKPDKKVTKAWITRKAMIAEGGANFFINGGQTMNIVERKIKATLWQKTELEADLLFFRAVSRCHGPDTVVEIDAGEFTLYQPS